MANKENVEWMLHYLHRRESNEPNRDYFNSMEEYCNYIKTPTKWAQRLDALIMSKVLNRPVILVGILIDNRGKREVAEIFLPNDQRDVELII